jgi:Type II secretion system (T2SS), protein E, N-terminal domain
MVKPRIGDILVSDGSIRQSDLDRALSNQAKRGDERIVSMLIAEGLLDPDVGARALGKQHSVPAALTRHIDARDIALTGLISADIAMECLAIPLAKTRDGALVICMSDPQRPRTVESLRRATKHEVIAAVAATRIVTRLLDQSYGDPDSDSFEVSLSTGTYDIPPEIKRANEGGLGGPSLQNDDTFTLAMLDDVGVARDHTQQMVMPTSQMSGGLLKAARAATSPTTDAVAIESAAAPVFLPLTAAPKRMAEALSRDAVTDTCFEWLVNHWHSALLFTIKDSMALGHRGFGGNCTPGAVDALAFPLSSPSLLKLVVDSKQAETSAPAGVIQDRLGRMLGTDKMHAAPVMVAARVMGVLVTGLSRGTAMINDVAMLAAQLGVNYARIIRSSKI